MKKAGVLLLLFVVASSAFADIPLLPEQRREQDALWKKAACNEEKNLLTCSGSIRDEKNSGCRRYQDNPKVYKWLARKGNSVYEEKYCHKIGQDK